MSLDFDKSFLGLNHSWQKSKETDLIKILRREEGSSLYGNMKYFAEVSHKGLKESKILNSNDIQTLENKIDSYIFSLESKWSKVSIKEKTDLDNKEIIFKQREIEDLLTDALHIENEYNWNKLIEKRCFQKKRPIYKAEKTASTTPKPKIKNHLCFPEKPQKNDYKIELSILDNIIKSRKEEKLKFSNDKYENAIKEWKCACTKIEEKNQKIDLENQKRLADYEERKKEKEEKEKKKYLQELGVWEEEKKKFSNKQKEENSKITKLKNDYKKGETAAINEYCNLILKESEYPISIPHKYRLDYISESRILVIDYTLPNLEDIPTIKEYKVIKDEIKEYYISEQQQIKIFDDVIYKITLRTIYELFYTDVATAFDAISFNGWVNTIDKATGKEQNVCILSIQVKKDEFMAINLKNVDPKTCFKSLKGVGSSKLSALIPIQPILQINKTDKRFVAHYDVADSLDDTTNLAAIDWQDFEHLIREVFGKEFSSYGGEVKITQASRDGGVDAIAFDPDPIRGGKIVIQAKRYTNTVGVSAVRDLYGTVMNEGATKGILVTTADYGPDAYEFAKGKPLTLMNGANLLYLLEKHGHNAKIDIKAARANMK